MGACCTTTHSVVDAKLWRLATKIKNEEEEEAKQKRALRLRATLIKEHVELRPSFVRFTLISDSTEYHSFLSFHFMSVPAHHTNDR